MDSSKRDLKRLVTTLVILLVFGMAARTPLDSDMWWHLKAGETTLETGHPVLTDLFSYTRQGEPWVNHSWLSQVWMAAIFRVGGLPGLCVFTAVLAALAMGLVMVQMEGPVLLNAFLVVLGCLVAAPVWSPRPQMASIVLLGLLVFLLRGYKKWGRRMLWLLPLLFCLWGNLHGGFIIGYIFAGLFILGEAITLLLERRIKTDWKEFIPILGGMTLSILALLINPNGLNTLWIPFQTVGVENLRLLVEEWASPDFHDLGQQPFLWLCGIVLICFSFSRQRPKAREVLVTLGFGLMGFMARRNLGPFAIAVLPFLGGYASDLWLQMKTRFEGSEEKTSEERGEVSPAFRKVVNLILIGLLGGVSFIKAGLVSNTALAQANLSGLYPLGAIEWIRQNPIEGNLFSEYDWGGYLIWTLPEKPVFVDGRTDLYGDEIIREWLLLIQAGGGWENALEGWKIQAVLLRPERPLVNQLIEKGWKVSSREKGWILLVR